MEFLKLPIYPTDQWSLNGIRDYFLYQEQGEGIISGKSPYSEFRADMPPLLLYLLAVPYVLGKITGPFISYKLFYSAFAVLGSYGFLYLDSFSELRRKQMCLIYAFNPLILANVFLTASDEVILSSVLVWMAVAANRKSYFGWFFLLVIGIALKYFPIVLSLVFLPRTRIDILKSLNGVLASSLVAIFPFLYLLRETAFVDIVQNQFASNAGNLGSGALSRLFQNDFGGFLKISEEGRRIYVILVVIAAIFSPLILNKIPVEATSAIPLLIFINFYPQFFGSYTLFPLPFLIVFTFMDEPINVGRTKILLTGFLISNSIAEWFPEFLIPFASLPFLIALQYVLNLFVLIYLLNWNFLQSSSSSKRESMAND